MSHIFAFDNSYARLPELFYSRLKPVSVQAPRIVLFNDLLAQSLELNMAAWPDESCAEIVSGNQLPEGAEPIAQAYAGHQFGHFNMLGDGRAILLGEHVLRDGSRVDVQLKGSGRTPFSRSGDGRAALGPMLREYLISEAMYALGIPTTRSLAVAMTKEPVMRETMLPGAVLTRIAASHIRVGTFEYVARLGNIDALRQLADYTIARHYPNLANEENPYLALLHAVIERQAVLIAKWMGVGFIHGVMNTDNMALSGETIDYGPCAFMDTYNPQTVFSSIDRQGRYAFANQPPIAQWNLARFAETLLPLLHHDMQEAIALAETAIQEFRERYEAHWLAIMCAKLGIFMPEEADGELINGLLEWMQQHKADYSYSFRTLASGEKLEGADAAFTAWHARWQQRLAGQSQTLEESQQLMRANNPAVIPRNHRVEEALAAAVERKDFAVLKKLLSALQAPYHAPENNDYALPPETPDGEYRTFCGT